MLITHNSCNGKHICKGFEVTTALDCCVTALKGRLRLSGQIIIFSHNTLHRLRQQWYVSSHNNKWLHLKLQGMTFSSGTSALTFASSAVKFKLPWPLLNTLFFSGQADIGTQLKTETLSEDKQHSELIGFACQNTYVSTWQY